MKSAEGGFEFWASDCCEDDLDPIARQVGQNAYGQSGYKRRVKLEGKPDGAKEVADSHAKDHSDDGCSVFSGKDFHHQSLYERKKDKSYEVSSGGTCQFTQASAESREYRKSDCAKTEIDKEADHASFYFEQVNGKKNGEVRKRDRNRADWNRDSQRPQNAEQSGHKSDQSEFPCAGRSCFGKCC